MGSICLKVASIYLRCWLLSNLSSPQENVHVARLKKAFGRRIAKLKEEARELLPNGSPEELAAKANELAYAQGYSSDFKPEKFKKGKGKRRKYAARTTPRAPAVDQTMVAVEAAKQVGGLTKLKKIVEELL